MLVLFHFFISCKNHNQNSVENSSNSTSQTADEQIWFSDDIFDEFGFSLVNWNGQIYTSAPESNEGTVFRLQREGVQTIMTNSGRLGHQIFVWNDMLYAHSPLGEIIVDVEGNTLTTGKFGAIKGNNQHWAAIKGYSLWVDGTLRETFSQKPFDLAICGDSIGVSFAFGEKKLWIDGSFVLDSDSHKDRYLHCFDMKNDEEYTWFLGGDFRILEWKQGNIRELTSPYQSFGMTIEKHQTENDSFLLIAAPDAGDERKGWVGKYSWPDQNLDSEWWGEYRNQRFGYSLLVHDDFFYVGAPNSVFGDNKKSYVKKINMAE